MTAASLIPVGDGQSLRLERRWPVRPLVEAMGGPERFGPLAGVHERTAYRWLESDRHVDDLEADRLAGCCRLHPQWVWPDWFAAIDLVDTGCDVWEQPELALGAV